MSTPLFSSSLTSSSSFGDTPIRRLPRSKVADIVCNKGIEWVPYDYADKCTLSLLCFKQWNELQHLLQQPVSTEQDLLWHVGWFASNEHGCRPGWAGFMHDVHADLQEQTVLLSNVRIHPILDKNPNDYSCNYSTLCMYLIRQRVLMCLHHV
jgi:hypothetical protein